MRVQEMMSRTWLEVKKVSEIIFNSRVSLFMVILSYLMCFNVDQICDAIVGFGDYFEWIKFVYFSVIGFFWAFSIWYWARCFYELEYPKDKQTLSLAEKITIQYLPAILGFLSLFIIGSAFLFQWHRNLDADGKTLKHLLFTGVAFVVYAIFFVIILAVKKIKFRKPSSYASSEISSAFRSLNYLNKPPRILLFSSTVLSGILLIILTINPYVGPSLGAAPSILFTCMTTWIPFLYWLVYLGKRLQFPVLGLIILLIAVFSMFNSNKDIRLLSETTVSHKYNLYEYFQKWYARINTDYEKNTNKVDKRVPLIMVLSEGGGIRAAYWSSSLLGRLQDTYPDFSRYIFGIYGVSGGSFGATVYASLLKEFSGQVGTEKIYQKKASEIVSYDFLSPLLTAVFTRGVLQLFLPFPIKGFDPAKVFEINWEMEWLDEIDPTHQKKNIYGQPFMSLWENDTNFTIPPLFINITRVEDGYPVVISNLNLPFKNSKQPPYFSDIGIVNDFYSISNDFDVRVSTASLLSARFPYVTPAGICYSNTITAGLVDGGYYDNSGANLASCVFMYLKEMMEKIYTAKNEICCIDTKSNPGTYDNQIRSLISYEKKYPYCKIYNEIKPFLNKDSINSANSNLALKISEYIDTLVSFGNKGSISSSDSLMLSYIKRVDCLIGQNSSATDPKIPDIIQSVNAGLWYPGVSIDSLQLHSMFRSKIMPVVVYIKNGNDYTNLKKSGRSQLYQLSAPINTVFQVRDAFSRNSLDRIKEFVNMYNGRFITLSLQPEENKNGDVAPLGWTLSDKTAKKIDERVEQIVKSKEISELLSLLP